MRLKFILAVSLMMCTHSSVVHAAKSRKSQPVHNAAAGQELIEIIINNTTYEIRAKDLARSTWVDKGGYLEINIPQNTPVYSEGAHAKSKSPTPILTRADRTAITYEGSGRELGRNGKAVRQFAKPAAVAKKPVASSKSVSTKSTKPASASAAPAPRTPASAAPKPAPTSSPAPAPTAPPPPSPAPPVQPPTPRKPNKHLSAQPLGATKVKSPPAQTAPTAPPSPAPEPELDTTSLLPPNASPLPTEADLAKAKAENDAALATQGTPPEMEIHPYSKLLEDKFLMRSTYLLDPKTGKATLDAKGNPKVFWIPNIDYQGDETVAYDIYPPHESRKVKKSATVPFHNVSELTADYIENGEVLIKKGEKIYEVEFDNDKVYFARADDPNGTVFNAPRSQFVTREFQKPLRIDLEDYRANSAAFQNAVASDGGMDDESEGEHSANSGTTPPTPADDEDPPTDHDKKPAPVANKAEKSLRGPSKSTYARDCNPKSGKVGKRNFDKLYAEKQSFSLNTRRQYKATILAAAYEQQIHPAIIEASMHLETDFNPAKENDTEKNTVGGDESKVNTAGKRKSFWGKGLGQIGPAECASMGIVWAGSYDEYVKAGRKPENSIWNPVAAIKGKARLMRMKLDEAKLQAAKRKINAEEAIAYMTNRPGEEGVAEQARYIISMFNRGMMSVNSLAYFVNHDSEKRYPKYYGQVWSSGPTKRNYDVYLDGHEINRAHIYRAAGLCGGIRPNSLMARYMKEYKESVDSKGKTVWTSAV